MSGEHCPKCNGANGFCSRCDLPRAKGTRCRNSCRNARWVPCQPHQTSVWTCDCCKAVLAPPRTDRWQSWPWVQIHKKVMDETGPGLHLCATCYAHWHQLQEMAETVIWDRLLMERGDKNVGQVFINRDEEHAPMPK